MILCNSRPILCQHWFSLHHLTEEERLGQETTELALAQQPHTERRSRLVLSVSPFSVIASAEADGPRAFQRYPSGGMA